MGRKTRDEWLRDVYARQRNVVFPDTVQNEARFWRNIVEARGKLTWIQVLGIVLVVGLLAFYVALMGKWGLAIVVGAVILSLWLNRKEWQKRKRS